MRYYIVLNRNGKPVTTSLSFLEARRREDILEEVGKNGPYQIIATERVQIDVPPNDDPDTDFEIDIDFDVAI